MQNVANVDEKVQEAALNAYSSLVEVAPDACNPLLVGLFQVLNGVVDTYKDGATIAMLDCIGTIAQSVGNGLASEEIMQTLLPLLNKKWEQIGDDNRSLLTLFECFEQGFRPFVRSLPPGARAIIGYGKDDGLWRPAIGQYRFSRIVPDPHSWRTINRSSLHGFRHCLVDWEARKAFRRDSAFWALRLASFSS